MLAGTTHKNERRGIHATCARKTTQPIFFLDLQRPKSSSHNNNKQCWLIPFNMGKISLKPLQAQKGAANKPSLLQTIPHPQTYIWLGVMLSYQLECTTIVNRVLLRRVKKLIFHLFLYRLRRHWEKQWHTFQRVHLKKLLTTQMQGLPRITLWWNIYHKPLVRCLLWRSSKATLLRGKTC